MVSLIPGRYLTALSKTDRALFAKIVSNAVNLTDGIFESYLGGDALYLRHGPFEPVLVWRAVLSEVLGPTWLAHAADLSAVECLAPTFGVSGQ
jgi:hypothetical protein